MSHLTVKSFLQQNQHILSTRENSRRIKKDERERKAKEAERAVSGAKTHSPFKRNLLKNKEFDRSLKETSEKENSDTSKSSKKRKKGKEKND